MEQVEGKTLDHAEYITVKTKPGYTEKFVKNELEQYGVSESVSTMSDLLEKGMGRALQSFAIINMVSLTAASRSGSCGRSGLTRK